MDGMKLPQMFLLPLVACGIAISAHASDVPRLLTEGQTAMMRGDHATAKRAFEAVNRIDPKNAVAIGYLRQIAVKEKQSGGGATVEAKLSQLILPKVEFKEASLGAALDFLRRKVEEVSGGKQSVNFVVQPGIDKDASRISIALTNIPFTEALRYIAELAGAKIEYQQYAVVLSPRTPTAAAAPAENPQP
jgi:hypothetical protein